MVEDSHLIPEALIPEPIVTEVKDAIAVVRFNRPAQRNPLSRNTLQELKRISSSLLDDEDIKAIIFTGTADVFASGADIRELAQLDPSAALEFSKFGQDLFQTIAESRQITIAAINGYCMGGGLDPVRYFMFGPSVRSMNLLCPRLTSATSSPHLSVTVAQGKVADLPG